jgi:hypothetical protein
MVPATRGGVIALLFVLVITGSAVLPTRASDCASEPPTGLVVVVKGLRLDRSMNPAVLSLSGEVLYGRGWWKPGELNQEIANQLGVVGYPATIQTARRGGIRPLVVAAVGVSGPPLSSVKTDVVVGEEDAARIRAANAKGKFLERLAVDFVVEK